ncbi:MAG: hypothetical protein M5T61_19480 [Acidimicrobiia bacterium]|nr:hypothetical protein [Acidimicrobiia bacterium]
MLGDVSAVLATVVGGIVVAVVLAASKAAWLRRHTPARWVDHGKQVVAHRRQRRMNAHHQQLVDSVLQRAEELALAPGEDFPVRVAGHDPAIITFHPTRRTFAMFNDLPSYKAAAEGGRINPAHAYYGRVPKIVERWTDDELRAWLHAHPGPPARGT